MQKPNRLTLSRHPVRIAFAVAVLGTWGGPLLAQPADTPSARTRIELPAAERQAMEATKPAPSSPTPDELLPSAEDAHTLPPAGEQQTVVKQVRLPNRTTEIRVTPALTGRTWTMTTREGREPISPTATSPGLSVPSLFTFEWGRTSDAPTANAPPPPSSATPR
jgi:hypothetical protein